MGKESIELAAFILDGMQIILQDAGHFVEGLGQNTDLVAGINLGRFAKVTLGNAGGLIGQTLDGGGDGLGQEEAEQNGNQNTEEHGADQNGDQVPVEVAQFLFGIKHTDDIAALAVDTDRDGHIEIIAQALDILTHLSLHGRKDIGGDRQALGQLGIRTVEVAAAFGIKNIKAAVFINTQRARIGRQYGA